MATRNEIGAMITANRDKQGLTIPEMAELVSIEGYKLHSLEDGKDYLNKDIRSAIDALLGITLPPLSVNNPSNRQEMYLGEELRGAREFNNQSQLEAAVAVGCCEGSIYTWEAGKPCNSTTRKLVIKYIKDTEDRLAAEGSPVAILKTTKAIHKAKGIDSFRSTLEGPESASDVRVIQKEVKVEGYTRSAAGSGKAGKKKHVSQAAYRQKKAQMQLAKRYPEPVATPKSPEDIVHEALQSVHKEKDLRDIVTIAVSIDQRRLNTIANYARSVQDAKPYLGQYSPADYAEE
jgi:ribosome-binding protein aMBF1 (putative translation factor)